MNTYIREYTDADWEAVCQIYDLSKSDEIGCSADLGEIVSFEDNPKALRLFEQSSIIVKEVDGQVVAFAGHKNNYISWLFVHPGYRGKGIGRKLLTKVLEGLSGTVMLNIAACNSAAMSLYESMGFTMEKIFIGDSSEYECQTMTLLLKKKQTSRQTVCDFFWRAIHGDDE